jgi:hypothetical protein
MASALRDWIDRALNWSGGAYVGLSTLTIIGLAIAEYCTGEPVSIVGPDGKNIIYIVHKAPEWYVGLVGIYTVILGLFWAGKPLNTWVAQKGTPPPPSPAPTPEERPMEK